MSGSMRRNKTFVILCVGLLSVIYLILQIISPHGNVKPKPINLKFTGPLEAFGAFGVEKIQRNELDLFGGDYQDKEVSPKANEILELQFDNEEPIASSGWVNITRTDALKLYAFSAYYDDRIWQSGRPPVPHVVIIGIWHKQEVPVYCGIWSGDRKLNHGTQGRMYNLWEWKEFKGRVTFVLHCPVFNSQLPDFVSIDIDTEHAKSANAVKIPVQLPRKPDKKKDFVICLKTFFEIPGLTLELPPARQTIEWIELNKLLGVNHIDVYNHSMRPELAEVFQYYAREGFVDIFPVRTLPEDTPSTLPARDLGINDCLYRNMHSFHKIINIDTDEIISPLKLPNLKQLLVQVAMMEKLPVENTQFEFCNQRYFLDDARIQPGPLVSQYAVRHVAPEIKLRRKNIADPNTCISMTSHCCNHVAPATPTVVVQPEIAVSYHYKSCEKSQHKPENCSDEFLRSVEDLSMRRFGKKLKKNVDMVLEAIGRTGI